METQIQILKYYTSKDTDQKHEMRSKSGNIEIITDKETEELCKNRLNYFFLDIKYTEKNQQKAAIFFLIVLICCNFKSFWIIYRFSQLAKKQKT